MSGSMIIFKKFSFIKIKTKESNSGRRSLKLGAVCCILIWLVFPHPVMGEPVEISSNQSNTSALFLQQILGTDITNQDSVSKFDAIEKTINQREEKLSQGFLKVNDIDNKKI